MSKVFRRGDLVTMCPHYSALERGQDHGDEITEMDIEDSINFVHDYQDQVVMVLEDQHPQERVVYLSTKDKTNHALVESDRLTLIGREIDVK